MKLLFVNKNDLKGGAARICSSLYQTMLSRGHEAYMAVARKESEDPSLLLIPQKAALANPISQFSWSVHRHLLTLKNNHINKVARRFLLFLSNPGRFIGQQIGHEPFHYPGSREVVALMPEKPDIVHLHNLHNHYFDLRFLPELSLKLPTIITLHDEWLMTGHCAITLGCERWQTGCGRCPDLNIYPAIRRDATHFNWNRKKKIYSKSEFYICAPSRWLLEKAQRSILAPAVKQSRLIPNGVNQVIFKPDNKSKIRGALGLENNCKIIFFQAAHNYEINRFKDFKTIKDSVQAILEQDDKVLFIAAGSDSLNKEFDLKRVISYGYIKSQEDLAQLYQAADLFWHAAFCDNYPTTILESLSCGTPVIASAVGGIPEQVKNGVNGFLVEEESPNGFVEHTLAILRNPGLKNQLSNGAIEFSRPSFSLIRMADEYENFYQEVVEKTKKEFA